METLLDIDVRPIPQPAGYFNGLASLLGEDGFRYSWSFRVGNGTADILARATKFYGVRMARIVSAERI